MCNQTSERVYDVEVAEYFIGSPMTGAELKKSQRVIKQLNEKDQQKVIIAEAMNLFESTLYESRSVLEGYESNADLPAELIEQLESTINEYLEWLDYESEGCTLKEIEEKHMDITDKIKHINHYELSLKTPLDLSEFNDNVEERSEKFASLNITDTALETFMNTPLTTRLIAQNGTYHQLKSVITDEFLPKVLDLLKNFESMDRLHKFNVKLEYMDLVEDLGKMNHFVNDLFKYRLRYLDTVMVKRERQLLREYEKAKMEKVKELGLKDKNGNSVEDMMEKAHKRAEGKGKNRGRGVHEEHRWIRQSRC
ncbi:unnamed protein product [Hanseniaspora opuntiae]